MENKEPLYKQKSSLSLDIELINENTTYPAARMLVSILLKYTAKTAIEPAVAIMLKKNSVDCILTPFAE